MGSRRRCCCGCWEFTDLFNRAASTDIGSDWNEIVGDWEIIEYNSEGMLHEVYGAIPGTDGTADAIAICTRAVPTRTIDDVLVEGEMFINAIIVDPIVGDIYRIYPCCTGDSAVGVLVVEFEYTGVNAWLVTIGGDSMATTGEPDPVTGEVQLSVCADHTTEQIRASVGALGVAETLWADTDPGAGQYAGIGHNNTNTGAIFNVFNLGELRTSTEICLSCFCACEGITLPLQLHGTFVFCDEDGNVIRMGCMENLTWVMNRTGTLTSPIWSGSVEVTTVESPPVVQTVYFTLICNEIWQLDITVKEGAMTVDPSACFTTTFYASHQSVSARLSSEDPQPAHFTTCDPLALMYGPWNPDVNDDCNWCYEFHQPLTPCLFNGGDPLGGPVCEGEFWIVITE